MPVVQQTNLTSGQLSQRLLGRTDISRYGNGAKEILNMNVMQHGGSVRRSGTKFVARTQDRTVKPRLIEFAFSNAQTYVLEFGEAITRFFTNRGQLAYTETLASPWASWSASVATITTTTDPHTTVVGDKIVVAITGATNYDGTHIVTAVGTDTISFALTSDPGGTPSAGTATLPYQITSPYTEAQLAEINYTQSADVLYLGHPDTEPEELVRSGATSWAFGDFDYKDGPWLDTNTTTTTLSLTGTSGSVSVDALVGTPFASTDVGRLIRWKDPAGNWTWLKITAFVSNIDVTATIIGPDASAGTATVNWRLGLWTDTPVASGSSAKSWPWVPQFSQNRLWWGGLNDFTNRLTSSTTGDFDNYAPSDADETVVDTNSIVADVVDEKVNAIYWMGTGNRGLMVGTDSGEFNVLNRAAFDPLTPTNIAVERQTGHGSKQTVRREQAGSGIMLFCQKAGRKIREFQYNFDTDQFAAPDLTILAEDITAGGIVDMAYQQEPYTTLWCLLNDGTLSAATYEKDQDVVGWHKHVIGGTWSEDLTGAWASWTLGIVTLTVASHSISVGDLITVAVTGAANYDGTYTVKTTTATTITYALTDDPGGTPSGGTVSIPRGIVESIAVIHDDSGDEPIDQVWLAVKRTIDGETRRYIEYIDDTFDVDHELKDAFFVDSGITFTGSDFTVVTGLDHLEGQTVSVLADGATHPTKVVASGQITLERTADIAHVGLPYDTRIVSLPIVMPTTERSTGSRFQFRRAYKVFLLLNRTLGAQVGQDLDNLQTIDFRSGSDAGDNPPPLFSGVKDELVDYSNEREMSLYIVQPQPLPMTLLSFAVEMVIDAQEKDD